jgi:hypothetical protein
MIPDRAAVEAAIARVKRGSSTLGDLSTVLKAAQAYLDTQKAERLCLLPTGHTGNCQDVDGDFLNGRHEWPKDPT